MKTFHFLFLTLLLSVSTQAAVIGIEANELGKNITSMGAEILGNGSDIPDWTGKMQGTPSHMIFRQGNKELPNPYASDSLLHKITVKNFQDDKMFLSDGLIAMLQRYPESFYLQVFPSHRDGRYGDKFEKRTLWNAKHTKLQEGDAEIRGYTGAIPFPLPKNVREIMWNARLSHANQSLNGMLDSVAVFSRGSREKYREKFVSDYPFLNQDNKVGVTERELGVYAGLMHVEVIEPHSEKGRMTIVQEPIFDTEEARQAWVYIAGLRRVRRFPTLGFDSPYGPGGIITIDDLLGFNGSMERFDWVSLGKKEMIVPYHAYRFDSSGVGYGRLLNQYHANPEFMRFEKHRVWVVEATLKDGQRHIYNKRRFFIDEDSWQIVLTESYDKVGKLWKVGILNTVYDYDVQGYVARAQIHHDLMSKNYVATRLINETARPDYLAEPQAADYYQPTNLRKMGNR